jgi:hypothetical protein
MPLAKSVYSELLSQFVDDGDLMLGVIGWVLGGALCVRDQLVDPAFEAVLLLLGIALILAENVERTARAHVARPGTQ